MTVSFIIVYVRGHPAFDYSHREGNNWIQWRRVEVKPRQSDGMSRHCCHSWGGTFHGRASNTSGPKINFNLSFFSIEHLPSIQLCSSFKRKDSFQLVRNSFGQTSYTAVLFYTESQFQFFRRTSLPEKFLRTLEIKLNWK